MAQGDLTEKQCLNIKITVWGNNHLNRETCLKQGKMISWIGVSEVGTIIVIKLSTVPCS